MAYCESNFTCPMTSRDVKLSRLSCLTLLLVIVTEISDKTANIKATRKLCYRKDDRAMRAM